MAGPRRNRCSGRFKTNSAWRRCLIHRMLPTPSPWRCAITIRTSWLDPMITKMTGIVNRVLDEEVRLQVGPLEYQVLVPEFIRRALQHKHGEEITLYTNHYLEGNPAHGRMVPRLIGFLAEAEQEF